MTMHKLKVLIAVLFFGITSCFAQQTTGIYKTIENYKANSFDQSDVFVIQSWGIAKGYVVKFKKDGDTYKVDLSSIWGYKDDKGRSHRVIKDEKNYKPLVILKDAPICVYGLMFSMKVEDAKGNLQNISCATSNNPEFFISKSIEGEVIKLEEENLLKLVKDNEKITAAINAGKYGKEGERDIITIINHYNNSKQ